MHNGHHILNDLLLWRKRLRVQNESFTAMLLTQVSQQPGAKASQPILVSEYHALNLIFNDRSDQSQNVLALKGETATTFHDPRIDLEVLLLTPLLERLTLIEQIRLLGLTRNPAIGTWFADLFGLWLAQSRCSILVSGVTLIGDRALGQEVCLFVRYTSRLR